jgi:SAM-dependent MidA family methyltransferase
MEECLYSEYGFFNTTKIRSSKDGDFLTSPEVSNYFGLFISNWIDSNKIKNNVLEVGPGTGSLASQIKNYSQKNLFLIEKSETAFLTLKEKEFNVFKTLDLVPSEDIDLIYMNEVLDNISCSIGVYKENKWFEKVIKIDSESLSYNLAPIREDSLSWIKQNNIEPLDDFEVEIQRNITTYLGDIVAQFKPKFLLIIDYGYEAHERSGKPYKSLIRTYKNHHLAGETILQPTSTDITYDVNFTSVKNSLSELGFEVELLSQKEFLEREGFLSFYKKMQIEFQNANGLDRLKIKSDLIGLEAIRNERGLGGFKILSAKKI